MKRIRPSFVIIGLILVILGLFVFNSGSFLNGKSLIKATVKSVDNSEVMQSSITRIGYQELQVEIEEGKYQGQKVIAHNELKGKPTLDNFFKPGDNILVSINAKNDKISSVQTVDLIKQNWELLLFIIFILLLIVYAGNTGLKAIFSFVASLYVIWQFLIPGLLAGKNPLLLSTLIIIILSAIILFSIAGFTKKGLAAFSGTITGLLISIFIAIFFGNKMGLEGMTSPYSATLLFSGHLNLNMRDIFYSAIVIGASGAAMDIAMDIAASMNEIKIKKPEIKFKELVQSGFNVGRAVIGTMTTTLLLAYSGSYLPLLMLFMSQNSSYKRIINYKIVAAEILRTLTGSIGLILVAPLTAIIAGWIYSTDFKFSIFKSLMKKVKANLLIFFNFLF